MEEIKKETLDAIVNQVNQIYSNLQLKRDEHNALMQQLNILQNFINSKFEKPKEE